MAQRTDIDLPYFKRKLEEELVSLEASLGTVAKRNPDNPGDWEPKVSDLNVGTADSGDVADTKEQYKENDAILYDLEKRYNSVKAALQRIEGGTYGICEVSGTPIEVERLEANPAARTCKAHIEEESNLS